MQSAVLIHEFRPSVRLSRAAVIVLKRPNRSSNQR